MYCCLTREPSLVSRLKPMLAELSVAEYTLTGMDTRPKPSVSEAIERAAMAVGSVLVRLQVALDVLGLRPGRLDGGLQLLRRDAELARPVLHLVHFVEGDAGAVGFAAVLEVV